MHSVLKMTLSAFVFQCCLVPAASASGLKPLKPGQYKIGNIQQICLRGDGTWFGTTFNFGGHWVNLPFTLDRVAGAIYGNYQVQGHEYDGYGNSAITVSKPKHNDSLGANWYDWFDDFSYQTYVTAQLFGFIKKDCDPPFKGENTHAATQ